MENALLLICGLSTASILALFMLQALAARVLTLAFPARADEGAPPEGEPPRPAASPATQRAAAVEAPADGPPPAAQAAKVQEPRAAALLPPEAVEGQRVFSPFDGLVDLVEVKVEVGDDVEEGQVLARVEAMNGEHEVKAPRGGVVKALHVELGAEVDPDQPILTIG